MAKRDKHWGQGIRKKMKLCSFRWLWMFCSTFPVEGEKLEASLLYPFPLLPQREASVCYFYFLLLHSRKSGERRMWKGSAWRGSPQSSFASAPPLPGPQEFQLGGWGWGEREVMFFTCASGVFLVISTTGQVLGQVFQPLPLLPCFSLFYGFVFPFPSLQAVLKAKKKTTAVGIHPLGFPSVCPLGSTNLGISKALGETDT